MNTQFETKQSLFRSFNNCYSKGRIYERVMLGVATTFFMLCIAAAVVVIILIL